MARLTASDAFDNTSSDFLSGRFSLANASRVTTGPRVLRIDWQDGATTVVRGQGFRYDDDQLVDGRVFRIDLFGPDGRLDVRYVADRGWLSGRQLGDLFESGSPSASSLLFGGNDVIRGSRGDDDLAGFGGNDTIRGVGGDDELSGREGNDVLLGGAGADTIFGGDDNDRLFGQAGEDSLFGGDGDDRLLGGSENDSLSGNNGNDLLRGGNGDDFLSAGSGRDILHGDAGSDSLVGGDGNDVMIGAGGDDNLSVSEGNDTLRGGLGADTFFFNPAFFDAESIDLDQILDFDQNELDDMFISSDTFDVVPQSGNREDFVRFSDRGGDAILQVDTDGNGDSFVDFAVLTGNAGTEFDFFVGSTGNVLIS